MAVGVVDLLEPIEVEHDDAAGAVRALRTGESGFELPIERTAVRQAGQRIGVRLVLGLFEPRRVVDDRSRLLAHAAEHAPVFVGEAPRHRVVDDEPANQPRLEHQAARQQRYDVPRTPGWHRAGAGRGTLR